MNKVGQLLATQMRRQSESAAGAEVACLPSKQLNRDRYPGGALFYPMQLMDDALVVKV